MGGTIIPDLTVISLCEADDWDGGVGTLDIESQIQGAGCLSITEVGAGLRAEKTETISAATMTDTVIYGWLTFARLAMLETYANGGLRFLVKSGVDNWSAWKIGGADTLSTAGWAPYCVRTNQAPDYEGTAGTANLNAVTQVGWRPNLAIKGIIKWDAFRYGTGLTIIAGTSGTPCTFDDIWAAESSTANIYGVVTKYEGIYFVQGKLNFGDATGTANTYFKDTSEAIVFKDTRVGSDFYDIKLQGNNTGTTQVFLGTKSGDAGISGCSFRSAGAPKFTITATDTKVNNLGFYGCTFLDASTISLPAYSTNKEVLNCTLETGEILLADTCTVKNTNFINADLRAVRMATTSSITNCNFISNPRAVHIQNSGTYLFDALMFAGNTYDVDNTSGGILTINCVNGANPSSTLNDPVTGTINIINTVYLTVDVKNIAGSTIPNASAYIEDAASTAVLMNKLTDSSGRAQETYNYTGTVDINVRIRKSSPTATRYMPVDTTGIITAVGYSLTTVMTEDIIA